MEMSKNLLEVRRICDALRIPYKESVKGATLTTIAVGGNLFLIQPQDFASLTELITEFSNSKIKYRIAGGGSNLLISDDGLLDPVIQLGKGFKEFSLSGNIWSAGASVGLMQFSRNVSEAGFSGLEFAGGIPAWIGGAVFMNAGAHENEISDVLDSVDVLLPDGKLEKIKRSDLNMQYRSSGLPQSGIIIKATFKLTQGDKVKSFEKLKTNLEYRKKTQPLQLPSCGSVFRNPSKDLSAGSLIEKLGFKGKKIGGASVSELHANWIINQKKNATYLDVETLINEIITASKGAQTPLTPEVILWGE